MHNIASVESPMARTRRFCASLALLVAALGFSPGVRAQEVALAPVAAADGAIVTEAAGNAARIPASLLAQSGDTGLMFHLHGSYYKITGRTNLFSGSPAFNAARARLYEVFRTEWQGFQGILRTGAYASNDGLAHLVAGKQIELLSDSQVAALVAKHLPQEAPRLLPAEAMAAVRVAAAPAEVALVATTSGAGRALAVTEASSWAGPIGVVVALAGAAALYYWWRHADVAATEASHLSAPTQPGRPLHDR